MPGVEFVFPIRDHDVPSDPEQFKHLIAYLAGQLDAGAKVHVGCIGGHGRTGMVLAARVKTMLGVRRAIQWGRKNYCPEIVETEEQVDFLVEHFKVAKAKPRYTWSEWASSSVSASPSTVAVGKNKLAGPTKGTGTDLLPISSPRCLWGEDEQIMD